jgi:hypothetical protein
LSMDRRLTVSTQNICLPQYLPVHAFFVDGPWSGGELNTSRSGVSEKGWAFLAPR